MAVGDTQNHPKGLNINHIFSNTPHTFTKNNNKSATLTSSPLLILYLLHLPHTHCGLPSLELQSAPPPHFPSSPPLHPSPQFANHNPHSVTESAS